jgi:peptide/nickel transport system permease protein
MLREPLLNTLPMIALGTILSIVLGVLVGTISAWRRGTFVDWGGVSTGLVLYSLPTQWLALLLVIAFAGILPVAGISDPFLEFTDPTWWEVVADRLEHMILPAMTLAIVLFGEYALITRSAILETLGEDYILTARAKGLSSLAIVRRHALRTALLPIATIVAINLGFIVGGAILVEAVFSYPGIGLVTYEAVFARDYPVLQGSFLILTIAVVFANYVADLLYFRLDPRVAA